MSAEEDADVCFFPLEIKFIKVQFLKNSVFKYVKIKKFGDDEDITSDDIILSSKLFILSC